MPLYPEPFEGTRSSAPAPSRDSAPAVVAPAAAAAVAAVSNRPPVTIGRPINYPSIIPSAPPVAEVVVYKGSDGRTGIVFADGRGPAVVAFLRAALPVASSESLFCGDRVISVNGRPVHSGREAVKAIKSAPGNRVSLSVDARGAETETRVVDRGGHSSIGLAVCNADPLHTLQSDEAGQVIIFSVEGDSPAELAGLKAGDTVLSVEGVAATNALFTREMIKQTSRHIALTVRPPSGTELLWVQKRKGLPLGFALRDEQHACVVHEVARTHAAPFRDSKGLRVNDTLIAINNVLVRSKDSAIEILRDSQGIVELRVMRAFPVMPAATRSISWSSTVR